LFASDKTGLLRRFAPRNDVALILNTASRSREPKCASLAGIVHPQFRGRRECRAHDAPAASHAK
jgi:hypothetical protein